MKRRWLEEEEIGEDRWGGIWGEGGEWGRGDRMDKRGGGDRMGRRKTIACRMMRS